MKTRYEVISTLQARDNLSWASANYEFDQTALAIQRVDKEPANAYNRGTKKAKVLEAYLGLEADWLDAFTGEF